MAARGVFDAASSHSSEEFTVVVRDQREITAIELAGELDLSTAPTLREAMVALDLDGGLAVQMDLSQLTFLDSSGMGLIVSVCKGVRDSGGTFSVLCDDPMIRKTLEVAGLAEYLSLTEPNSTESKD